MPDTLAVSPVDPLQTSLLPGEGHPRSQRMSPYPRTLTDLPDVPSTPPVTMTIKEAAAFLGLSLSATYEAAARGEIPTMKIGRRVLVKREQLVSMVS